MEASRKKVIVGAGGSEEVGLAVMKVSDGEGQLLAIGWSQWPFFLTIQGIRDLSVEEMREYGGNKETIT